ncbi:hypothetical protein SAMN05444274_10393 [Mariniphaga anaerophila]|uniref:Zinc-or iron-chelating domain-containing protein n=1 Tax=Mariniphaga anaerophila TaxID=1484053 RepID=A0A1M4XRC8_9BACT|nr:hypothetical protein [Mariniphaga anaerophila]SHE96001.1 hypothetical protein SAMN05444274_10393 [Mariniphaga anaerophila]
MSIDLRSLERQFHSDGYRLGMEVVDAADKEEALLAGVKVLLGTVDELVDSFSEFAARENQKPECKKGCFWCCHQPVFALNYELVYLKDFISRSFDAETQKRIAVRAGEKKRKLERLSGESLLNSKFPCPLLEDGSCIAYAARPVACRIYLSTKLQSCLKFYSEPENEDSIPELLQLPMRLGRMLNEGFKSALKAGGIDVTEFRVEEKLAG